MQRIVFVLLAWLALLTLPARLFASSEQAYRDYLYQYDVYRQNLTDFKIAKSEYDKFKTLTSETTLLEKTKTFLARRDDLLRAYLLLLNEKLNEDRGLIPADRQFYQRLIQNEVVFLQNHRQLVPSVGSLGDTNAVSQQLESHYSIFAASVRQTIVAINLGRLHLLRNNFDEALAQAQTLIESNRELLATEKQTTLARWLVQINSKRSLFEQKIDLILSKNADLKSDSIETLDAKLVELQKDLTQARQYLFEANTFLAELVNNLRYAD